MVSPYPIMCSWTISMQDIYDKPMTLTFGLTNDNAPLNIGLGVQRYSKPDFTSRSFTFTFLRPPAEYSPSLPIYINRDDPLNIRAYVDIVGRKSGIRALSATTNSSGLRPTTLAKRLHRYSHAPRSEMVELITRTGVPRSTATRICRAVVDNFSVWKRFGLPEISRNISLTHIFKAFNNEIQADFMFASVRSTKYCVLHVVDTGTEYSETSIKNSRSAEAMASLLEIIWINLHGTPTSYSAESELTRGPMVQFLKGHGIKLNDRPIRRHDKTRTVEWKHWTIKTILERLRNDLSRFSDAIIISRATFLSNVFSGSKVLSSFDLARGYKPAVLGVR